MNLSHSLSPGILLLDVLEPREFDLLRNAQLVEKSDVALCGGKRGAAVWYDLTVSYI